MENYIQTETIIGITKWLVFVHDTHYKGKENMSYNWKKCIPAVINFEKFHFKIMYKK